MSQSFASSIGLGSTTNINIYTCGGDSCVVFGLSLTNRLGTDITVSLTLYDTSAVTTTNLIAPDTPIVAGETLVPVGGIQKIVLESGDILRLISSDIDSVDYSVSAIEFTA